jgi:B12-binding domain/radical SAM domain protein
MKYKIVFYDVKENKYSINALLGALEKDFKNFEIGFVEKSQVDFWLENIEKDVFYIFCVSFFTTQFFETEALLKRIKEKIENVKIIAGGPHASGDPYSTLKIGADIVVVGEGEKIFPEIIKRIISGEDVKGIFKGESFVKLDDYFPFSLKFKRFGPIEISRGCPYGCYFCQTPRIFGGVMRHRSTEKILDIVKIMNKLNLKDIRFITPNAFAYGSLTGKDVNLRRLEELLYGIRNIIGDKGRIFFGSFPSEVRPEHVREEILELLKTYADNDNLVIGAQSGSQRILDLAHRGHTVEDVYRAVSLTLRYGLKANVDFIFGLPYEEERDIEETLKFIEELVKMGARVHAHTFMPLPGTPFAKFPPGKLEGMYKKIINRLLPKGVIFGNFREQEKVAWEIYNYFSLREE